MVILEAELQRGAQLMRIERAVAALIDPAGILLDERRVADLFPRADAGGIASEVAVAGALAVVGAAVARKTHRHVRVAFAGSEAVAHADDEQILDDDLLVRHLAAADLDADRGAGRIGNGKVRLFAARLRDDLAAQRPAERRCQPGAGDARRLVDIVECRARRGATSD